MPLIYREVGRGCLDSVSVYVKGKVVIFNFGEERR